MTTRLRIFIVRLNMALMIVLSATALLAQSVKITSSPNRDISKLSKYAWKPNQLAAAQKPEVIAQMDRTIKEAVNRELTKRGYAEDQQHPDFLVQVAGYGVPDIETSANPDKARYPYDANVFTSQSPGGPGVSAWMAIISNVSFTFTDGSSNDVIWQADVKKKYKDPKKAIQNLEKEIGSVVSKALQNLPSHK